MSLSVMAGKAWQAVEGQCRKVALPYLTSTQETEGEQQKGLVL